MATGSIKVAHDTIVVVILVVGGGVDTDLNPCEEAIGHIIAEVDELREGVKRLIRRKRSPGHSSVQSLLVEFPRRAEALVGRGGR